MPVYMNDEDTLRDYFERTIKAENYWIDPLVLSEWIYGYNSDDLINRHYPEVLTMIDEAKKIAPNVEMADVVTELFVVINEIYSEQIKSDTVAWQEYYEAVTQGG